MAQKFTKILFPTDLTEHSRHCFDYVASLAARYRASIIILHVIEGDVADNTRNMLSVFLGSEKVREFEKQQDKHAQDARSILIGKKHEAEVIRDALCMFCDDAKDTLPDNRVLVKHGDITHRILSVAKSENCDLIVMGHGKYNTLAEAVIGSTTKSILKKSTIPVLVIPPMPSR